LLAAVVALGHLGFFLLPSWVWALCLLASSFFFGLVLSVLLGVDRALRFEELLGLRGWCGVAGDSPQCPLANFQNRDSNSGDLNA
jgi:hypothetical protein